jgi:hypothetical protein
VTTLHGRLDLEIVEAYARWRIPLVSISNDQASAARPTRFDHQHAVPPTCFAPWLSPERLSHFSDGSRREAA